MRMTESARLHSHRPLPRKRVAGEFSSLYTYISLFARLCTDVRRACTGLSASRVKAPSLNSASKLTSFPRIRGSLQHCDPS